MNITKHTSIFIALFVLVSCGGGSSTDTPNTTTQSTDPNDVPIGSSFTDTLTANKRSLSLPNIATITFSDSDASLSPTVTIEKKQHPESNVIFTNASPELGIQTGSTYEVEIKISSMSPPTSSISVELNLPNSLISLLDQNSGFALYVETPGDDDQPPTYFPVETTFQVDISKVSANIPDWAFVAQDSSTFIAKIKIGLSKIYPVTTPRFNNDSTSQKLTLPTQGESTTLNSQGLSLICPMKNSVDGCVETSRKGKRVGGKSWYHFGIDFRANYEPVYAVHDGQVIRTNDEQGEVIIQSAPLITKYLHLSSRSVDVGDSITAGSLIGTSGTAGTAPHLHFEALWPITNICKTNKGTAPECASNVGNYLDPFPYMISHTYIKRSSSNSSATVGESFALELFAQDTAAIPVTTKIDNSTGTVKGTIRKSIWDVSGNPLALSISPNETIISGNPEVGMNPTERNRATVTINTEENATVTANWDSVGATAYYSPIPTAFWEGTYTYTSRSNVGGDYQPSGDICSHFLYGSLSRNTGELRFREGLEQYNVRRDYVRGGTTSGPVCQPATSDIDLSSGSFIITTIWEDKGATSSGPFLTNHEADFTFDITSTTQDSLTGTFIGTVIRPAPAGWPGNPSPAYATCEGVWEVTKTTSPFPKCTPYPDGHIVNNYECFQGGAYEQDCDWKYPWDNARPGEWLGLP